MTTTVFSMEWTNEEMKMYFVEKEILYKDFKDCRKDFKNLPTVKGSYKAETKTIVVYYPRFMELAKSLVDEINQAIGEEEWNMSRIAWLICKATDKELRKKLEYYDCDDEEDTAIRNSIKTIMEWRKTL